MINEVKFTGDKKQKMSSELPQLLWWCHLVNAHEGKAGMVLFAGKTV